MKKVWPYLILLVALGVVIYLWQIKTPANIVNTNDNSTTTAETSVTPLEVNFVFSDQREISLEYPYNSESAESLFKITQDLAAQQNWTFDFQDYGELGLLVTQIDNQINNTDNKYWQYFADDQQPQVSVDKYFPAADEEITWKFIPSEF